MAMTEPASDPVLADVQVGSRWLAVRGHWRGAHVEVTRVTVTAIQVKLVHAFQGNHAGKRWMLKPEQLFPYYAPLGHQVAPSSAEVEDSALMSTSSPSPAVQPAPLSAAAIVAVGARRMWTIRYRRWVESEELIEAADAVSAIQTLAANMPEADVIGVGLEEA